MISYSYPGSEALRAALLQGQAAAPHSDLSSCTDHMHSARSRAGSACIREDRRPRRDVTAVADRQPSRHRRRGVPSVTEHRPIRSVVTTMLTVRSILCPVDFSEQSRQALLWASVIAQYRGGELTVLSVIEPLLAQAAGIRLGVDLVREEAEAALREFVDATLPEGVRQASHVRIEVTVGDPAEAILQTGRRLKAGVIVMGTHGLGGFRKLLLGSTTEHVLRRTEWPVLAVPPGAVSAPAVEHPRSAEEDSPGDRFSRERDERYAVGGRPRERCRCPPSS